jgi:hypothetical protein
MDMTQDSTKRTKPKWTGFMAGWAVFLAFYQTFLAAQHGGLFLGENNLVRQDLSSIDLAILYSLMGVLFLIIAYGIWTLKWWAFPVGLVVQGMVIAVALSGIIRWLALGQQAPVVWDTLDLIFAVINLAWALSRDVRTAFITQASDAGK